MKISEQWLRDLADPPVDTSALARSLTMAGLKVDAVTPTGAGLDDVVVATVVAVEPHPDADTLTVCTVDVGAKKPQTIVCGANNVRVDMRVPAVLPGAHLPGGIAIKVAELRGVRSEGMLCSGRELGLSDDHSGLFELSADLTPGTSLVAALGLDDNILELDLTPNRGDCLSALGVAREIAAIHGLDAPVVDCSPVPAELDDKLSVAIDSNEDCTVYCGRLIRDVDALQASPVWMQERLRRAGIRPQGLAVDVTAYVMLETGQPMHAFDAAKLQGTVRVRRGRGEETLELLDGTTVTLNDAALVIADDRGPLALAGIMGGAESAVSAATKDVFLESAHFTPQAVAGRARGFGLHTDASHRFERGVDPSLPSAAIERASSLLRQLGGGRPGPVTCAGTLASGMRPESVGLRAARLDAVLGMDVDPATARASLIRLGLGVADADDGWTVQVPWHRFDLAQEVDLIEEVGRLVGFDEIPSRDAPMPMLPVAHPDAQVPRHRIDEALLQRGYQQVITYSFVAPTMQRQLGIDAGAMDLANPISADLAQMRTSLWPGLLECLRYNLARQQSRVMIFETGLRFITQGNVLKQIPTLGLLSWGERHLPQWGVPSQATDFYDLKAVATALGTLGGADALRFVADAHPALHPGQSARVERGGQTIGWIGSLHPAHAQALYLPKPPVLLELDLEALYVGQAPATSTISRFPAVRRDLALLIPEEVTIGALLDAVDQSAPEIVTGRFVFDIYRGKGVEPGIKSVALGLILQETSRTLTDTEADQVIGDLVADLGRSVEATLRDG